MCCRILTRSSDSRRDDSDVKLLSGVLIVLGKATDISDLVHSLRDSHRYSLIVLMNTLLSWHLVLLVSWCMRVCVWSTSTCYMFQNLQTIYCVDLCFHLGIYVLMLYFCMGLCGHACVAVRRACLRGCHPTCLQQWGASHRRTAVTCIM